VEICSFLYRVKEYSPEQLIPGHGADSPSLALDETAHACFFYFFRALRSRYFPPLNQNRLKRMDLTRPLILNGCVFFFPFGFQDFDLPCTFPSLRREALHVSMGLIDLFPGHNSREGRSILKCTPRSRPDLCEENRSPCSLSRKCNSGRDRTFSRKGLVPTMESFVPPL